MTNHAFAAGDPASSIDTAKPVGPIAWAVVPGWLALVVWFAPIDSWWRALLVGSILLVGLLVALGGSGFRRSGERNGPTRHNRQSRLITMAAAFLAIAFSLGIQQALEAQAIQSAGSYFTTHSAVVELSEAPKYSQLGGAGSGHSRSWSAEGRVQLIDGRELGCLGAAVHCTPRVRLLVNSAGAAGLPESADALAPGDRLRVVGLFRPAQASQRESVVVRVADFSVVRSASTAGRALVELRAAFDRRVAGINSDARSLVAGFATGQTAGQSVELRTAMKVTGLTHLTAVSGANCVIVCGAILFVIGRTRLSRRSRLAVAAVGLVAYVALVGQQPSVLRAAVMVGSVFLAHWLGRRINPIDALAAAVLVLLVANPWLAIDFGFALSALATLGLLALSRPVSRLALGWLERAAIALRLPNIATLPAVGWLVDAGAVVVAASLLCLPLTIALSGAVPAYSIPANLLAEPLVAPATILGILGVAVVWFAPWLTVALTWLASLLTGFVAVEAKWFAGLPLASLPWPSGGWGVALAVGLALTAAWLMISKRYRRVAGLLLALFAAIGVAFGLARPVAQLGWPGKNWFAVACDVGQGDALVLRSLGHVAVIDVGRDDKPIDECLTRLGVTKIDLLVLTHFDADHVAGLAGAARGRHIDVVLETPWVDTRPQVGFTQAEVAKTGARVVLAQQNLSGTLGQMAWRVLTPSKTASEAEDSNDGSIGMYWQLASQADRPIAILTLADLGEKGQMRIVETNPWLVATARQAQLVIKVAHHGSADCYPELYEQLQPSLALVSVGANNGYGHPTTKALHALELGGAQVERTDKVGSIAVSSDGRGLDLDVTGGG